MSDSSELSDKVTGAFTELVSSSKKQAAEILLSYSMLSKILRGK